MATLKITLAMAIEVMKAIFGCYDCYCHGQCTLLKGVQQDTFVWETSHF